MPAFLKKDGDILTVSLGGMKGPEFGDALARVKSIPGRRYNPDEKRWELPCDADTALRVMQMLEPVADAEVQAMVQARSAEVAGQLVTRIGDDAELLSDSADRLRPYQRAAVDWLCGHPKSILADEMGLGKTVEALVTINEWYRRHEEDWDELPTASLIVCPNNMRGTWEQEIRTWCGEHEPVQVIDGRSAAKRTAQVEDDWASWYIVNWEKLRIMPELAKRKWLAVIADEAHRAKNPDAQQTQALWRLQAPLQLALSGTPIMNHPGELWSLLRWLRPEEYAKHLAGGGYWPFHYSYVEEYTTKHGTVVVGVKNADQLRFVLSDKLVRRTKKDVLKDLPEKLPTQVIEIDFTPAERKLYEEVEKAVLLDMATYARKQAEEDERWEEDLAEALVEEKLDELSGMPLNKLAGLLDNGGARLAKLRQLTAAAKVRAAVELIREEPETPVVAFTWHVDAARQLAEELEKGKPTLKVGCIAGPGGDVDALKDAFQTGELDHLVCNIAKGGEGLTLTRSSNPILVEEDWTPAKNEQAIDRTHRYGQTDPVTPRALRVRGTVDTGKIAPANRLKKAITETVLGASE